MFAGLLFMTLLSVSYAAYTPSVAVLYMHKFWNCMFFTHCLSKLCDVTKALLLLCTTNFALLTSPLAANHSCSSSYTACTPWSYWGGESCGYQAHGGDCANFVSQSLIQAGHPYLNQGYPCRGYPCGKEEVGATNLGNCLANVCLHWDLLAAHCTFRSMGGEALVVSSTDLPPMSK